MATTREKDIAAAGKRLSDFGLLTPEYTFAAGCAHRDTQTIARLETARAFYRDSHRPDLVECLDALIALFEAGEHVK